MNLATALCSIFFLLIPNIVSFEVYALSTAPRYLALSILTLFTFLLWLYYCKAKLVHDVNKYVMFFTSCFFIWALLSTEFSMHMPTALSGGYNVNQGFWTHMMYILIFLMAASLPVDKIILSRAVVNAMVILAGYAMLQYFGLDPFDMPHGGKPVSFIGNSVAMAGAILLALPFSVYLAITGKGIGRAYWTFTAYLFLATIAASLSRGAMLGVFAIGAVMAIFLFKALRRVIILAVILGIVLMSGIIFNSKSSANQVQRFNITEMNEDRAASSRLQYWHIAWQIIKDHPFFGVGPDNFKNAYPLYRTPELDKTEKNSLNSKAHNGYLQIAATMGIPALIFYLGLMASVIMVLWRQKGNRLLAMTFLAALVGYLVQDISGWQELGFTPLMWAILGIGVSGENYKPERMNWIFGWTEGQ